jgi:hypothetical protein
MENEQMLFKSIFWFAFGVGVGVSVAMMINTIGEWRGDRRLRRLRRLDQYAARIRE